jgi:hypothetical protein
MVLLFLTRNEFFETINLSYFVLFQMETTKNKVSLEIGDPCIFQVTGDLQYYLGEVTGIILDEPVLKVTENGPYSILKTGDFILNESATILYQQADRGDKNSACEFITLNDTLKVASGLNTHGITDDVIRYINLEVD